MKNHSLKASLLALIICHGIILDVNGQSCSASFTYSLTGNTVRFVNTSPVHLSSTWDFGHGGYSSMMRDPVFSFYNLYSNTYNVCLTTSDSNGCQSTYCEPIFIPGQQSQHFNGSVFCDSIALSNWPVFIKALPVSGSPVFTYEDTFYTDNSGSYSGFTPYNGASSPYQQWEVAVYDSFNSSWIYDTVSNCGGVDSASGYALTVIRTDTSMNSCVSAPVNPVIVADNGWSLDDIGFGVSFVVGNQPVSTMLNVNLTSVSPTKQEICNDCTLSPCSYVNIYHGNSPLRFENQYYDYTSGELFILSKSEDGGIFYLTKVDASGNSQMMIEYNSSDTSSSNSNRNLIKADNGDLLLTGAYSQNRLSVLRINSVGNLVWAKSFDNIYPIGRNLIIPSVGDSYIIGVFDNIYATLLRIDGTGSIVWSRSLNTGFPPVPDYMWFYDLISNGNGGCLFTGISGFVGELDFNGDQLWLKKAYKNSFPELYSLTQINKTKDGGYLLSGSDFSRTYIMKINANLNISWVDSFETGWHQSRPIEDNYGFIYIPVKPYLSSPSSAQVIKLNSTGNLVWSKTLDYLTKEEGDRFEIINTNDSLNNIILVGSSDVYPVGNGNLCDLGHSDFQLCPPSSHLVMVWPGDANADGIANNQDVLAIGVAYGASGTVRPNASINWIGQTCSYWSDTFATGANYHHADCNGEGLVDSNDVAVISLNYGLTHAKTGSPQRAVDPDLFLEFPRDTFSTGDTVFGSLLLGTSVNPIANVYGLAFSLNYNQNIVDSGSFRIDFTNSWFAQQNNRIALTKDLYLASKIDAGASRTDHTNATGAGKIADVSFVIQDNIDGKDYFVLPLEIQFEEVIAIDKDEAAVNISANGDTLYIEGESVGIKPIKERYNVRIFPNPATDEINVIAEMAIIEFEIMDIAGRTVMCNSVNDAQFTIDVSALETGSYLISLKSADHYSVCRKLAVFR